MLVDQFVNNLTAFIDQLCHKYPNEPIFKVKRTELKVAKAMTTGEELARVFYTLTKPYQNRIFERDPSAISDVVNDPSFEFMNNLPIDRILSEGDSEVIDLIWKYLILLTKFAMKLNEDKTT